MGGPGPATGGAVEGELAWRLATRYHDAKREIDAEELRERVRRIAARAILARAARVLGTSRRSARLRLEEYSLPGRGDLALEETWERILGKEAPDLSDVMVKVREEKRVSCVLMLDTSLSMTGRNLALAGVAAAVLAMRLHPEDYAVISFETAAHVVKGMGRTERPEGVVEKILDVPATGYTNIEDALKKGRAELERGRHRDRFGILITDGVYTMGGDPRAQAAKFPRLYVLVTEDYKMDRALCAELAGLGHGRSYPLEDYSVLPAVLNGLLREVMG